MSFSIVSGFAGLDFNIMIISVVGRYTNKKRGMRKVDTEDMPVDTPESLTEYQLKRRLT
jgi:hypothetical protein